MRAKTEEIRKFILNHVEAHPDDIAGFTAEQFGVTRQAINKHIAKLVSEKILEATGSTRNRRYALKVISETHQVFDLNNPLSEDVIWRDFVSQELQGLPDNARNIWQYGFTEIFNNVIDHSDGKQVVVNIQRTAATSTMDIADNGIGIFKKITDEFKLLDQRHALLELAKGKLTTDPDHHSGEGIYFTSRMFDEFWIISGDYYFNHKHDEPEDWLLEGSPVKWATCVIMRLNNHSTRTVKDIFDQYSAPDDYSFSKTVVPVRMAKFGDELLISRSQAKRILARIEVFSNVVFDFAEVKAIGQAFADEIFRVFANQHPNIKLEYIHANSDVLSMIKRALSRNQHPQP